MASLKTLFRSIVSDFPFLLLLAVLIGLSAVSPRNISDYPWLVDWPTIATLTGLLILTKGVELSGFLDRLGSQLIRRMKSERMLALLLVSATAMLATVLTNDVALFVVVPLTLTLRNRSGDSNESLPVTRLVIFEALAANAGSALTPIGNPQNLYLWQRSATSFAEFTGTMVPLMSLLMLPLLILTVGAFSGRSMPKITHAATYPVDSNMLATSLALYLPFLVLTDLHYAPMALVGILAVFLSIYRRVLMSIDWGLLLVFVLMFIDLRLIATTGPVMQLLANVDLSQLSHLYLTGIAASQLISNVPAAILLSQYSGSGTGTEAWRILAYGVNIGGSGLVIGSMANLIALRLAGERRAWWVFHVYSLPFLLVTGAIGYVWLQR